MTAPRFSAKRVTTKLLQPVHYVFLAVPPFPHLYEKARLSPPQALRRWQARHDLE
jgi:hypothetical protein